MKKIVGFLYFLVMINSVSNAQELPRSGSNLTNNNLDKFVGTWMWTNGKDTVTMLLKKENILFPGNIRTDAIVGFHLYKKDKKAVSSSLEFKNTNYSDKRSTILATGTPSNLNTINGIFNDLKKDKSVNIHLTVNQNVLQANFSNREGIRTKKQGDGFSLPEAINFTRQ
ncbi:DUF6705 family protein [Spirosoma endbachense]|uniref:DUF6705 domain-containing protein n=1 Tax=Spirosoma endbachense TaxID=2666025 RepID=A0A6P1W0I6_9BACT|nr:DUF6705 family protein [Spirosoma endbachense]QHV98941.1 hypothetical protein GJR95_29780 [Spirosoma endbachense]